MKAPLLGGIVIAVLISMTAMGKTLYTRFIFAAASILVFYAIFIWSFYEYDKTQMQAWKSKEKRLRTKAKS